MNMTSNPSGNKKIRFQISVSYDSRIDISIQDFPIKGKIFIGILGVVIVMQNLFNSK